MADTYGYATEDDGVAASDDLTYAVKRAADSLREDLGASVKDKFADGTVIRYKAADRFTYALLKTGGKWWITGSGAWYGKRTFDYDEVVEILGRSDVTDIRVATAWTEI